MELILVYQNWVFKYRKYETYLKNENWWDFCDSLDQRFHPRCNATFRSLKSPLCGWNGLFHHWNIIINNFVVFSPIQEVSQGSCQIPLDAWGTALVNCKNFMDKYLRLILSFVGHIFLNSQWLVNFTYDTSDVLGCCYREFLIKVAQVNH